MATVQEAEAAADTTVAGPGAPHMVLPEYECAMSVVIVSFNTREMLRECLDALLAECGRLKGGAAAEIVIVDNASRDGSADMAEREYAGRGVKLQVIRSEVNLGFGAANNRAFREARGKYLVMLNSDAFLQEGALQRALERMEENPTAGVGGARLVGRDGSWQPSARRFHTLWIDTLVLSGLASRFPQQRIFGAPDRTWASPDEEADVDWVPGAFSILRREALERAGVFDPAFFLYYEEVDLYRRIKAAGFRICYWPEIVVTHVGGESGRQLPLMGGSKTASMVELWRMRSALLYYRKHFGWQARVARWQEQGLYHLRWLRNRNSNDPARRERAAEAKLRAGLMSQAWRDTEGGRVSPPCPW